jgi:menaquinone-dependent protoporphyrinogen oxidase
MAGPVLVTYASKYGSTREVAEAIAATLRDHLLRVVVQPSDEVDDLGEYHGVVLGGGIYMGRWHRDARRFVRHFEDDLRGVPVALFALGPVDDEPSTGPARKSSSRRCSRRCRSSRSRPRCSAVRSTRAS